MTGKYIYLGFVSPLVLAVVLAGAPALCGDLEGIANTLENLADMSRSADDANEAFKDAMRGNPSRYHRDRVYYRDYSDRDYYRHRDYDDDDWKWEKKRAKAIRKHEKEWRKEHARHHRPVHHQPHVPPFARHLW